MSNLQITPLPILLNDRVRANPDHVVFPKNVTELTKNFIILTISPNCHCLPQTHPFPGILSTYPKRDKFSATG